jgi:hypothetical protein
MREACNLAGRKGGAARESRKLDRVFMLELARALGVSERRIKRDGCGDWNIVARRGHIATDGTSSYAYLRLESSRRWKAAKRILRFLSVSQDGDNEGIFHIREMPTAAQAVTIRKALGLRKAPLLTDEQRASRRLNLAPNNQPVSSEIVYLVEVFATKPPDDAQNAKNRANCEGFRRLKRRKV